MNETYKYMGRRNYSKKGLDETDKNFLNFKVDKPPDFAMQCREIIPKGLQVNPLFHFIIPTHHEGPSEMIEEYHPQNHLKRLYTF